MPCKSSLKGGSIRNQIALFFCLVPSYPNPDFSDPSFAPYPAQSLSQLVLMSSTGSAELGTIHESEESTLDEINRDAQEVCAHYFNCML